jgi:hypothetical protein
MHKTQFYYAFLQHLRSPVALPPRLLYREAIKLVATPMQPTSSRTVTHCLPTSFPMTEKERELEKQI